MPWQNSAETHIWIFNVGRGNAAFVRTGLNDGFIIDMACSDEFSPAEFIRETFSKKLTKYKNSKIAQAVLSHPHRDHIQECEHLKDGQPLRPQLLTCPNDKQPGEVVDWDRFKDDREGSADLLQAYRNLFDKRSPPLQTILYESAVRLASTLEYGLYYLRPPLCQTLHREDDNEYGNATSIMFYLRHGVNTILFPGDMTPEGMENILNDDEGTEKRFTVFKPGFSEKHPDWHQKTSDQPGLGTLIHEHGLSILVAPHHGLESCFSQKLYDTMKNGRPQLVIISEKRHTRRQDGEIHGDYRGKDGASGLPVWKDGAREGAFSLSTVNGHHILIVFNGVGAPRVYAERDPNDLLQILG